MLAVLRQEPAALREFDSFMSGLGHEQTPFHPLARSASTLQADIRGDLSNVGAAGEIFPDWLAARLLAAGASGLPGKNRKFTGSRVKT
jgi:hypothetical protein